MKRYFAALLAGLLLAGCSSSDSDPADSSRNYSPRVYQVEITGMKFKPDTLYVQKGDSVVFVNKGIVSHNVTALDSSWTSGPIPVGTKWGMKITSDKHYYCSIHIIMKGEIFVE